MEKPLSEPRKMYDTLWQKKGEDTEVLWAAAGWSALIRTIPGVAYCSVDARIGAMYTIQFDPRYNKQSVKDAIISRIGGKSDQES